MPYKRFHQLNEEKKSLIIETAIDEFLEKSFKVASINQISKRAGLSAGALYYYFEDKEDLFYTVLEHTAGALWGLFEDLNTLFDEYGYWDGIETIVMKRLELTRNQPKYLKLLERVLITTDEVEMKGQKKLMSGLRNIFEYGYENGHIRTDMPKEFLFAIHFNLTLTINQWMIKEWSDQKIDAMDIKDVQMFVEKAVGMIRSALS